MWNVSDAAVNLCVLHEGSFNRSVPLGTERVRATNCKPKYSYSKAFNTPIIFATLKPHVLRCDALFRTTALIELYLRLFPYN